MAHDIQSYEQFWPFYLSEHGNPLNRKLHFIGTSLVVGIGATALVTGQWWMVAAMPVAGYGFAWVGHFIVEKNRPATLTYPLWSLRGDFEMWWKTITGELDAELEKHVHYIPTDSPSGGDTARA
jgi:hypothetical protein